MKKYSAKDKITLAMVYGFTFTGGYLVGWIFEKLRQIGDD